MDFFSGSVPRKLIPFRLGMSANPKEPPTDSIKVTEAETKVPHLLRHLVLPPSPRLLKSLLLPMPVAVRALTSLLMLRTLSHSLILLLLVVRPLL